MYKIQDKRGPFSSHTIEVYNNFFSSEIHKKIWELMLEPKWSICPGRSFWHINFLEKEDYFSKYLFEIICKKLRGRREDKASFKCGRVYANGQTAGQSGRPHVDDSQYTFLYFPNPEWQPNWGGNLIFLNREGPEGYPNFTPEQWKWQYEYNKKDEISKIVTYRPNRAVLFPGNAVHYAEAPHNHFNGLRTSVAFKLLNPE